MACEVISSVVAVSLGGGGNVRGELGRSLGRVWGGDISSRQECVCVWGGGGGNMPGVKSAGVWEGGIFEGKLMGDGMPEGNSKLAGLRGVDDVPKETSAGV